MKRRAPGNRGDGSASGPPELVGGRALTHDLLRRLESRVLPSSARDRLLFSGHLHDSIPRALLLDTRLTPLERNAWQVFRLKLADDGNTAFPSYEELRPYLASMPCSALASDETIARAITLLRLTRWLTLARRRRDPVTQRIQSNLYVLHDEPLSAYEAIQLDVQYLELVGQSLVHASRAIQRVAAHTIAAFQEDELLSGRISLTRLQVLLERAKPVLSASQCPSSESEDGDSSAESLLRNPKTDPTVRTEYRDFKEVRTVPRARDTSALRLPARFKELRAEHQAGALAALDGVEERLRQSVLDEWAARCDSPAIKSRAGYLFGIVQKALRGEFHPTRRSRQRDITDE